MKLLIVTQVVDTEDPVLGFFVRWIEEFAKQAETVTIICLREGKHALPANVSVYSLGKERKTESSFVYAYRFLARAWKLRRGYDSIFVHMNPEYIVLAGIFWRLSRKRVVLWYTHKNVNLTLRIATALSDTVCTASAESFLLPTKKLRVMGHGIDSSAYGTHVPRDEILAIMTIGRISHTKRIAEMLDTLAVLRSRGTAFSFTIVGAPVTTADKEYAKRLRERCMREEWRESVSFVGPIPHAMIPSMLANASAFINLSDTGSLDKAVLEALAAGVPAVSSNRAFREMLGPYGLYVQRPDPESVANALEHAASVDTESLVVRIRTDHSLQSLIPKLVQILEQPV